MARYVRIRQTRQGPVIVGALQALGSDGSVHRPTAIETQPVTIDTTQTMTESPARFLQRMQSLLAPDDTELRAQDRMSLIGTNIGPVPPGDAVSLDLGQSRTVQSVRVRAFSSEPESLVGTVLELLDDQRRVVRQCGRRAGRDAQGRRPGHDSALRPSDAQCGRPRGSLRLVRSGQHVRRAVAPQQSPSSLL